MKRRKRKSSSRQHARRREDGAIHARIALVVAIPLITFGLGMWKPFGFGVALGAVIAILVTPDFDHEWKTWSEGFVTRWLGSVAGKLFRLYWSPYEICFEHRSPWTHGGPPPFGWLVMALIATPLRVIYSLWGIGLLCILFPVVKAVVLQIPYLFWVGLWAGWAVQDIAHWCRDYL